MNVLESPEWNKVVFTFAIIEDIKSERADLNRRGIISLSELTDGARKPRVYKENIEFDFRIC